MRNYGFRDNPSSGTIQNIEDCPVCKNCNKNS